MTPEQLLPTGISADRNRRELTIRWSDASETRLGFALLRSACPCAQCRGGHANMGGLPEPDTLFIPLSDKRANELQDVQVVGNYALTITWGDGHNYGIYGWAYLKALGERP